LRDLDVRVGQFTSEISQQIVVHRLVDTAALGDEPVVDTAEFGEDGTTYSGFLVDLAPRRFLGGLAPLDVPLRQRPQQPSATVGAADQRRGEFVGWPTETVDDETSGRGLPDGA